MRPPLQACMVDRELSPERLVCARPLRYYFWHSSAITAAGSRRVEQTQRPEMGAHFPTVRNENNCHFSHFSLVCLVRLRCANVSLSLLHSLPYFKKKHRCRLTHRHIVIGIIGSWWIDFLFFFNKTCGDRDFGPIRKLGATNDVALLRRMVLFTRLQNVSIII
jgi:hypothetical protein